MLKNNAYYIFNEEHPYQLSDAVFDEAMNKFADEIRPNFSYIRGIAKARAIKHACDDFFHEESPALESWLRSNGFLE